MKAATTSSRGQAFQYRVEMARFGGWYLEEAETGYWLSRERGWPQQMP